MEEIGATDGTTFLIRQLFYNIPARRKFLKTPMTEASHVNDVLMRLALSHRRSPFALSITVRRSCGHPGMEKSKM